MKFVCSNCSQRLDVKETWAGRKINCPNCDDPLVVPSPGDNEPVAPVSEQLPAPLSRDSATLANSLPSLPGEDAPLPPPTLETVSSLPKNERPSPDENIASSAEEALLASPPSAPGSTEPLLLSYARGKRDPVKIVLSIILFITLASEYEMYRHHESPQQAWQRLTGAHREIPLPVSIPSPGPPTPPALTLAEHPLTAAPSAVSAMGVPEPASAPIAWLAAHRNRWPKETILLEQQDFPAVFNGKVVGSVSVPAGAVVAISEIRPDELTVVAPGGGARRISPKTTNLLEFASLEMKRPEPPPTPTPSMPATSTPVLAPMIDAATIPERPVTVPTPDTTPKSTPSPNYFGTARGTIETPEPVETSEPIETTPQP